MAGRRRLPVVACAAIALVLGACSSRSTSAPSPVIDTWPVGQEFVCATDQPRCNALIDAAIDGLDTREPGHAPLTSATLHLEGGYLDAAGSIILPTRSGDCCSVVVFQLTNGEVRAIGVGYPGISDVPVAIPWGP